MMVFRWSPSFCEGSLCFPSQPHPWAVHERPLRFPLRVVHGRSLRFPSVSFADDRYGRVAVSYMDGC